MAELHWITPATPAEALQALGSNPDAAFHSGGTGLLRTHGRSGTLIDLQRCNLGTIQRNDRETKIGATATLHDVMQTFAAQPGHMLMRALSCAAAPALRNRITVGGSVAMFPPWSNVVGALAALDAHVGVASEAHVLHPSLFEYYQDRRFRSGTLVTEVVVPARAHWIDHAAQLARTNFDYAAFSLFVSILPEHGVLADARVVLTGSAARLERLTRVEDSIRGAPLSAVRAAGGFRLPASMLDVEMPARYGFSSAYLREMVGVYLNRALDELVARSAA